MSTPRFSIVIVSLNGARRLPSCLGALQASLGEWAERIETIVVDNGSRDDTSRVVGEGFPWVRVVRAESNRGFAGGNNLGLAEARGEICILLNDDTYPEAGWLGALDAAARAHPGWGALGCLLLYPGSRKVQHAGGTIEPNGLTKHVGWGEAESAWFARDSFEADYVTGAAMAIAREALELLGPLDAAYFPIYFEETDFCSRLRAAEFGVWVVPTAIVLHDESQVTGLRSPGFYVKYHTNRWRFLLKTLPRPALAEAARAELRWLWGNHPWDLVVPLVRAWCWNLLRAPATYRARLRHFASIRRAREARGLPTTGDS